MNSTERLVVAIVLGASCCFPVAASADRFELAISEKSISTLEAAIQDGCDPNVADFLNGLPLQAAIRNGWIEAIEPLLDAGADPLADDGSGNAIETAASLNETSVLKIMSARGVPMLTRGKIGRTPLHAASSSGALAAMEFLLDLDSTAYSATNDRGETPLHTAARDGQSQAVRLLLSIGADPNARDGYNLTPLHHAATGTDFSVVRLLVEAGTPLNVISSHNMSELDVAFSKNPDSEIVKYLRSKGAKPAP